MKITSSRPDESVNLPTEHPLREAGILLAGAVAVIVALVLVAGLFADVAAGWISPETEREIFEPFLPSVLEAFEADGVDEEAGTELQAALDRVLGALAARAGEPAVSFPLKARVFCTELPNAVALPGGIIGVTSGLLRELQTDNELAFVLGHEVGHFLHRDHLRSLGRGVAVGVVLQAALAIASVDADDIVGAVSQGALQAHSRGQETDADRVGADTLQQLFGHVGGGEAVLNKLSQLTDESWVDRLDFTRTHPVGDTRIRELVEHARAAGMVAEGELRPIAPRLRLACSEQAPDE